VSERDDDTEGSVPPTRIDDVPTVPLAGDGKLYVKFINVGLGDCTLITMPNGKVVLVDCGSARLGGVTAPAVRAKLPQQHGAPRNISLLVLTHPDRDHYSLIGGVIQHTYINEIRYSMDLSDYRLYNFRKWYWQESNVGTINPVTVNPTSPAEVMLLDGGNLTGGGNIKLYAVAANVPYPGQNDAAIKNTASVVTVIRNTTTNDNLVLIAADATCTTENFMLGGGRVGRVQNVQILRVGHHGSDTSSRTTFVQATNPSHGAVVSSSLNNGTLCLPKQSVVTRWLNQMPNAGAARTVGFWLDGAGTECARNSLYDDELIGERTAPSMVGIPPYNYGTVQRNKEFYETFLDGDVSWNW
jgi:beta-lactamase superfamily II metal-dependent hydrolase